MTPVQRSKRRSFHIPWKLLLYAGLGYLAAKSGINFLAFLSDLQAGWKP